MFSLSWWENERITKGRHAQQSSRQAVTACTRLKAETKVTLCTQIVLMERYHQSSAFKLTQILQSLSFLPRWNEQTHTSVSKVMSQELQKEQKLSNTESSNHIHVSRTNILCSEWKEHYFIIFFYTTASTFHMEIYYAGMKNQCVYLLQHSKWNDGEFGNVTAKQLATRLILMFLVNGLLNIQTRYREWPMRKGRAGNVDLKVYSTISTHGADNEQTLDLCLEYG